MADKITVSLNNPNVLPYNKIELGRRNISLDGKRAYFSKQTIIGDAIIPADTVFVFSPLVTPELTETMATVYVGTWTLNFGIHRGDVDSRDVSTVSGLESLEAAREKFLERMSFLRMGGYVCWYAHAYPPGGTEDDKVTIDSGVPYSR